MDYLDDELYDTKVDNDFEAEQNETLCTELKGNNGKLIFKSLNLPGEYIGEKISSQNYRISRDEELKTTKLKLRKDNFFECGIHETTENGINSDFKNKVQVSELVSRELEEYEKLRTEFSIIDKDKLKNKVHQEKEHGENVKNQLKISSDLLAIRIFTQDILKLSNRMPLTELMNYIDEDSKNELNIVRNEILQLIMMNYELQINLARKNPKLLSFLNSNYPILDAFDKENSVPKKRLYSEIKFWENYNAIIDRIFGWCIDICDLLKRETQIQIQRKFKVLDQSIRTQLKQTLLNVDHVLDKSRPNPNSLDFIGLNILKKCLKTDYVQDLNKTIYDDSDSFVLLLKEIISSNSNRDQHLGAFSSHLLNKNRKIINSVDRRASKGRKIRYVPIPKLENFMASSPSFYYNSHLPGIGSEEFVDCIMESLLLA